MSVCTVLANLYQPLVDVLLESLVTVQSLEGSEYVMSNSISI